LNHSRGGIFHSSSGHAPGHRFDTIGVPPLIDKLSFGALIADEGSDSDAIIADLNKQGAKVVIRAEPADRRRNVQMRHPVENFFANLKEFKRIAMCRQNRRKLQRNQLSRHCRHQFPMNLNRP
jgi:transposase